ncbi:MAG: phosphate acetyltransferase, partial [Clostridia bacterium]|nr:phosphate acetyltransferase [Clostridia bacterium]
MTMLEHVYEEARQNVKRIVLPEGSEPRTVQAAAKVLSEGLAKPILLGDPDQIRAVARETGADLSDADILDPVSSPKAKDYAAKLYELRKAKGLSKEEAERLAGDPMYYGMLMVKLGDAD